MLDKIKKKLNYKVLDYILPLVLVIILFTSLDIPKKLYKIISVKYENRLVNYYGHCSKEGYGFIKDLKKKYDFKFNPIIINYRVYPSPYWISSDTYKKKNTNNIILINYPDSYNLNFNKIKKKKFISINHVEHSTGIENINFELQDSDKKYFKTKINIYKKNFEGNKYLKSFEVENSYNSKIIIPVNFISENLNERLSKFIIELENNNVEVKNIYFSMLHKYDVKKMKILENKGNCYYVKK